MRLELFPALRLPHELAKEWDRIHQTDAILESPFFAPGFTMAAARARSGIEVGVVRQGGEVVAFFPFQRCRFGMAAPPAAGFNEFHGLIAAPGYSCSAVDLIAGCRLSGWRYDHLPTNQSAFSNGRVRVGDSPFLDLRMGFSAWSASRRQSGSQIVSQARRKRRKLEREAGPVRFQLHDTSLIGLQSLLSWKSAQHRRTGVEDVFKRRWVVRLLDEIQRASSDGCRGLMSVLFAGGRPVAVHLGLRSRSVAHLWYPAYDFAFGRYSPGVILLLELARELSADGIQRIDLGPGGQPYKERFSSGAIPVAMGVVDRFSTRRRLRSAARTARHWLRSSRYHRATREIRDGIPCS